jgi:hypothetical protein
VSANHVRAPPEEDDEADEVEEVLDVTDAEVIEDDGLTAEERESLNLPTEEERVILQSLVPSPRQSSDPPPVDDEPVPDTDPPPPPESAASPDKDDIDGQLDHWFETKVQPPDEDPDEAEFRAFMKKIAPPKPGP